MSWIEMNPALCNILICFETAGRLISKLSARLLIVKLSSESSISIFLLLGSPITWNASSLGCVMLYCVDKFFDVLEFFEPAMVEAIEKIQVFFFCKTAMLQEKLCAFIGWLQFPNNYRVKVDLA